MWHSCRPAGRTGGYRRDPWLIVLRPKLSSESIFWVQSGQIPWVNWASVRALIPNNDLHSLILMVRVDYSGIADPGIDLPLCRNPATPAPTPPDPTPVPVPVPVPTPDPDPQ